jgi:hypothetical protein
MKITKVVGLVVLGIIAASPIEAISRAEHNALYNKVTASIAQGRKLITSANPENAVVSLQKIMQLKQQIKNDISRIKGWPTATTTLNKLLEDSLGSKHLAGLQKKIEEARQAAQVAVAAAKARADQETARVEQEKQAILDEALSDAASLFEQAEAEEVADAARRRAAAIMPKASAPAELAREGEAIANFDDKMGYEDAVQRFIDEGRMPIQQALAVVKEQEKSENLNALFEKLLLPFMLANYNPNFEREGQLARGITQVFRFLTYPARWIAGSAGVPLKGEFTAPALQAYDDWASLIASRHGLPAREDILKKASNLTKKGTVRPGITKALPKEKHDARSLLDMHLTHAKKELAPRPEIGGDDISQPLQAAAAPVAPDSEVPSGSAADSEAASAQVPEPAPVVTKAPSRGMLREQQAGSLSREIAQRRQTGAGLRKKAPAS